MFKLTFQSKIDRFPQALVFETLVNAKEAQKQIIELNNDMSWVVYPSIDEVFTSQNVSTPTQQEKRD